jgi:MarR family transcriptional regulator, organic hydroperoxide resistance regulator
MNPAVHLAPEPVLGEALELMRHLWALDQGLQKASKRMEATLGITAQQRLVVRMVGRFPGITMTRLADLMRVHPSTVSGIVKRLERRGLVVRKNDPRDRRRAYLGLTPKGRGFQDDMPGTVEAAVQRVLKTLPEAHIRFGRDLLIALTTELIHAPEPTAEGDDVRRSGRK